MRRSMIGAATIAALAAMGLQYTGSRYEVAEMPDPNRDMFPAEEVDESEIVRILAEQESVKAMREREREVRMRGEHPISRVSATRDFLDAHKKRKRR